MYIDYIDAGFRIFGLYGAKNNQCECGNPRCEALYKHPRINKWPQVPIWSDDQLETMSSLGQFNTGFGVLVNDHLIIDVDPRNGGDESLKKLSNDLKIDFLNACGFAVETGGGGWHLYYKLETSQALVYSLPQYPGIDFKSSGFVVGAGSLHKSGLAYEVHHGELDAIHSAPESLLNLLIKPTSYRSDINGAAVEVDQQELGEMLQIIDADCDYDQWLKIGMALHEVTGGAGFELWDSWSRCGKKYKDGETDKKWHGFGKSPSRVGFGTLKYIAEQHGYIESVTFDCTPEDLHNENHISIDTSHIDINRPPGLLGDLVAWINSQCRYPRERIATGAAMVTLGNLAGLKYFDAAYGVTSNLFLFCVAGSATGKEAVLRACTSAMISAGMSSLSGSIKSEQEIIRALVSGPQVCYTIDEIGYLLAKIVNAQKKGGSSYLEGIIGMLMSVYSKANGELIIGRDQRKDALSDLSSEISALKKREEDGQDFDEDRLKQATEMYNNLIKGYIKNPFLSLIGFTTPVTFNQLIDYEQSTNGFIGRSLLIQEKETNPKAKRHFKMTPMPEALKFALAGVYAGSDASPTREGIKTTGAGLRLLDRIQEELHEYAEDQKETGLESIARRAFEQVLKISLIASIGDSVRDVIHVEYAYAFVRKDIDEKINLAAGNVAEQNKDLSEALVRKIIGTLDVDEETTTGVICNRLRKYKKEDVLRTLDALYKGGRIVKDEVKRQRGKSKETWRLKKVQADLKIISKNII